MEMNNEKIPLVVVCGPTASGKTKLAVDLCKQYQGEAVSADSMQLYRYMNIGTAKPTEDEKEGIPHHLMDFLQPDETFSVADFVQQAQKVIAEIHDRGHLPVVVGGTGLYIRSLVDNIDFSQVHSDPAVHEEIMQMAQPLDNGALWKKLQAVDPTLAQTLHPNNRGRVLRALEVYRLTGVPMSEQQRRAKSRPSPYRSCMIGLSYRDRQVLYDRINRRVDLMLEQGLLQEAKWMFDHGFSKTAYQAIGYKELKGYFDGETTLEAAVETIKMESRRYAKRQLTWFRRDERIHWIYLDELSGESDVLSLAREFMIKDGIVKK